MSYTDIGSTQSSCLSSPETPATTVSADSSPEFTKTISANTNTEFAQYNYNENSNSNNIENIGLAGDSKSFSMSSLNSRNFTESYSICEKLNYTNNGLKSHNQQPISSFSSSSTSSSRIIAERKSVFVEALVDSATLIIESMWSFSTEALCYTHRAMPLKRFVQETLRRSRTSYSTLQLALYYLILIKPYILKTREHNRKTNNPVKPGTSPSLRCGRRTFLAALMLASKYSQDRNYSAKAWSKVSGLKTKELCENELLFLKAVDWNLFVDYAVYERWSQVLFECACDPSFSDSGHNLSNNCNSDSNSNSNYNSEKYKIWIERFRNMDVSITNCNWQSSLNKPVTNSHSTTSISPEHKCENTNFSKNTKCNSSNVTTTTLRSDITVIRKPVGLKRKYSVIGSSGVTRNVNNSGNYSSNYSDSDSEASIRNRKRIQISSLLNHDDYDFNEHTLQSQVSEYQPISIKRENINNNDSNDTTKLPQTVTSIFTVDTKATTTVEVV